VAEIIYVTVRSVQKIIALADRTRFSLEGFLTFV